MIRVALALLATAGIVVGGCSAEPPGPPPRPDIVLVVWDTVRADRLSCYGYGRPTTPVLDALAAEGVRFLDCATTAPWTPPAHGSMFTGLQPVDHGLYLGRGDRLRTDVPTVAERLAAAGYETVGFSANAHISPLTGLDRGFRRFTASYAGSRSTRKTVGADVLEDVETWLTARTVVEGEQRPPVFLFVNLMDAHLPLLPPSAAVEALGLSAEETARAESARAVDQRAALGHALRIRPLAPELLEGLPDLYDASIRHLDEVTGRLLARLRVAGIADRDALVVVTSDHGEHLGEHGLLEHRMSVYDPVLRVPLVLHRTGSFEGGRAVSRPVSLVDLHPTLLHAAGLGTGPAVPGAGRLLTLREDPGAVQGAVFWRPDAFAEEFRTLYFPAATSAQMAPFGVTLEAVRGVPENGRRHKLIRGLMGRGLETGVVVREELYELISDPGETRNLLVPPAADESNTIAKRLAESRPGGTMPGLRNR